MPSDDFTRFRALVDEDDALRDELWKVRDPESFAALVVRLGAEYGLIITAEDVRAACADGMTAWLTVPNFW
jgi:hypothetical protein